MNDTEPYITFKPVPGWDCYVDGKPITHDTPSSKQLMLLAAAEESYSQAAVLLLPCLKEMLEDYNEIKKGSRLDAATTLLEEAMAAHNRYMESLQ